MHIDRQRMNRLATSIVASMVALSALSQVNGNQPQLVVGIVIDQLRSDYLELLQSQMGDGGFKRLMRNGASFDNAAFNCQVDATSGTALLMTGAYPRVNGVTWSQTFDQDKLVPADIFADSRYIGNFTTDKYSAAALLTSTLADEVRIDNNGLGCVYAMAADAQTAIALAGHAANGACWINSATGNWASTTYYPDVPQCVQTRNYSKPLSTRLDTMQWQPLLPAASYTSVPESSRYYAFRHTFGRQMRDRYTAFKQSALANEEVTSVAIDCLNSLNLGKRGQLDMLNIGLSAAPVNWPKSKDGRFELADTYVRLDRQIARLLAAIDRAVGLDRAVVFVASNGNFDTGSPVDAKFNIPTGEFRPDRAVSLLNMYLMAVHGNGNWVTGYHHESFFLNRKLIKERNIDLATVRREASQFLRQMSGITAAYTFEEILSNPASDEMKELSRTMVPALSGDVMVEIAPGWDVVTTSGKQTQVKHVRATAACAPIMILAPQVKAQRITSTIDAALLAPTVARLLRIRSPNAARLSALSLQ